MTPREERDWLKSKGYDFEIDTDDRKYHFVGKYHEQCHYCEKVYHPMMRYTKGGMLIYVCHLCSHIAKKNKWTRRPDLTPKR